MMGKWLGTTFTGSWWGSLVSIVVGTVKAIRQTFIRTMAGELFLKTEVNESTVKKSV